MQKSSILYLSTHIFVFIADICHMQIFHRFLDINVWCCIFEFTYFLDLFWYLQYLEKSRFPIVKSGCCRFPRLSGEQSRHQFWHNLSFWQQRCHHPLLANTRDWRANHQVSNTLHQNFKHQSPREGLFMVDSGGQYLDGTTDVTRTFHYGSPTEEMIERYTDVLQVPFPPVSVTYTGGRITNVNLNYTLKIDTTIIIMFICPFVQRVTLCFRALSS